MGDINRLIDMATDDMMFSANFELNLQIVDILNNKPTTANTFARALYNRLSTNSSNAQVVNLGVELIDMVLKNCGPEVYAPFGSEPFSQLYVSLYDRASDGKNKDTIADFLQFYGGLFSYRKDLYYSKAFVALKTKTGFKSPPPRQDTWKPHGYKEVSQNPSEQAENDPITPQNLYYKMNELKSTKELFLELLAGWKSNEDDTTVIDELYSRCESLHNQFVAFLSENSAKTPDKIMEQLLQENDSFSTTLEKYRAKKKKFDKMPKKPKVTPQQPVVVNTNQINTKQPTNQPNQPQTKQPESNPLIGNLLDFTPSTTQPQPNTNQPLNLLNLTFPNTPITTSTSTSTTTTTTPPVNPLISSLLDLSISPTPVNTNPNTSTTTPTMSTSTFPNTVSTTTTSASHGTSNNAFSFFNTMPQQPLSVSNTNSSTNIGGSVGFPLLSVNQPLGGPSTIPPTVPTFNSTFQPIGTISLNPQPTSTTRPIGIINTTPSVLGGPSTTIPPSPLTTSSSSTTIHNSTQNQFSFDGFGLAIHPTTTTTTVTTSTSTSNPTNTITTTPTSLHPVFPSTSLNLSSTTPGLGTTTGTTTNLNVTVNTNNINTNTNNDDWDPFAELVARARPHQ
eukprot:TRINITY_DN1880_c1_g3_i1.p1 TRINITY_DN1880_c1_g3~~TRINITY_DN1880_c1_g3_i1.p1  ORF type:complete len:619 (+),score=214.29 TRINITY_DN1880_c1_g3_i1:29-1885(+)